MRAQHPHGVAERRLGLVEAPLADEHLADVRRRGGLRLVAGAAERVRSARVRRGVVPPSLRIRAHADAVLDGADTREVAESRVDLDHLGGMDHLVAASEPDQRVVEDHVRMRELGLLVRVARLLDGPQRGEAPRAGDPGRGGCCSPDR